MLYRYTTVTEAGLDAGWRAWRGRISASGVFLIHCHTLQHMIMGKSTSVPFVLIFCINVLTGMQTLWVIGSASDIQKIPLEESEGYFYYGGDAYGNETFNPHCSQQFSGKNQCSKPWSP